MADKRNERCLKPVIFRTVQITITVRQHLIAVRVAFIKTDQVASVGKGVEKFEPLRAVSKIVKWHSYYGRRYGRHKSTNWN